MKTSHASKVKAQYEKVLQTFKKYADFGAEDSEPHYVLRKIIRKAMMGDIPDVPTSATGWLL